MQSDVTKQYSKPRESERDFRIRLSQSAREHRDQAAEAIKLKYVPYIAKLNEGLLQAQNVFDREQKGALAHKYQSAQNLGKNVLGEYMGRKAANWAAEHSIDVSEIAHRTGASKPIQRTAKDEHDKQRATETVESLSEQIDDLNLEFGVAMKELETKFDPLQTPLLEIPISVMKSSVSVPLIALAWAPFFRQPDGTPVQAWIRAAAPKA